jgi:hypothetical protein
MSLRITAALAMLAAGLVLVTGAGAGTRPAAPSKALDLSSLSKIKTYLRSIGVNPRSVVIQRAKRNYAGPNCPGSGWNCTTSTRVLKVGGQNTAECTDDMCVGAEREIVRPVLQRLSRPRSAVLPPPGDFIGHPINDMRLPVRVAHAIDLHWPAAVVGEFATDQPRQSRKIRAHLTEVATNRRLQFLKSHPPHRVARAFVEEAPHGVICHEAREMFHILRGTPAAHTCQSANPPRSLLPGSRNRVIVAATWRRGRR